MHGLKQRCLAGVVRAHDQVHSPEIVQVETVEAPVVFECQGSDHALVLPRAPVFAGSGPGQSGCAPGYLRQTKPGLQSFDREGPSLAANAGSATSSTRAVARRTTMRAFVL